MEKSYSYKDKDWRIVQTEITEEDLISLVNQAEKDYNTSRSIVHSQLVHIWNWSLRAYHMGVTDRQIRANLKTWQSNIAFGLIRSFIDVFISTLTEKPVTFAVK